MPRGAGGAVAFPDLLGLVAVARDFHVKRHVPRAAAACRRARSRTPAAGAPLQLGAHYARRISRVAASTSIGLALYDRGDYRDHARLYGNHDTKVCAHGEQAQLFWIQGRPLSALAQERALHGPNCSITSAAGCTRWTCGCCISLSARLGQGARTRHELVTFASDHALSDHRAKGLIFRGWAVAVRATWRPGCAPCRRAWRRSRRSARPKTFRSICCLLAEALAAARPARPGGRDPVAPARRIRPAGLHWMPEFLRSSAANAGGRSAEPTRPPAMLGRPRRWPTSSRRPCWGCASRSPRCGLTAAGTARTAARACATAAHRRG